jgi:hypothetical protein
MGRNWVDWHRAYDEPGSSLRRRLLLVQQQIREALDARPAGPISVLSMCAGQGRDLLGVLADHPRRADVTATLVELDPRNVELARQAATGLDVTVIAGDAGLSTPYQDAVPADIALVCGVFGNLSDEDIRHTVGWLPRLCREGATVIWTRQRRPPDRTGDIRAWFKAAGFAEVAFHAGDDLSVGVGAHRFTGRPLPFQPDVRMFAFTPDRV